MFQYWLQGGRISVGFLGGAQIDRFANINSSVIGAYAQPEGAAAGRRRRARDRQPVRDRSTSSCRRPAARSWSGSTSSPRSALARAATTGSGSASRTAGPTLVITDLCLMEPDPETKELIVVSLHAGRDARAGAREYRLAGALRRRRRRTRRRPPPTNWPCCAICRSAPGAPTRARRHERPGGRPVHDAGDGGPLLRRGACAPACCASRRRWRGQRRGPGSFPRRRPRPLPRAAGSSCSTWRRCTARRRRPAPRPSRWCGCSTEQVGAEAGRFVHWGATSQDAIDTALVLQMRAGLDVLMAGLLDAAAACADLAERHRATLMAGRTLLQQALPIPFGLKAARWLALADPAGAGAARAARPRAGAPIRRGGRHAGRAGRSGHRVSRRCWPRSWGCRCPTCPGTPSATGWPGSPPRWASPPGAMAKIAGDLVLLAQSEVGEVARGRRARQGRLVGPAAEAQPGGRDPGAGGGAAGDRAGAGGAGGDGAGARARRGRLADRVGRHPARCSAHTAGAVAHMRERVAGWRSTRSTCGPTWTATAAC